MVKEQICEPKISDAGPLSTAPVPEEHRQCNKNKDTGRVRDKIRIVLEPWIGLG